MIRPLKGALPDTLAALAGGAAVLASVAGFIPGLYRDVPAVVAQSHGYDVGNIIVSVVLGLGLAAAARGSIRGRLVAAGALGCLLYSFVTYAFEIVVNPVTVVYIAVLGLGTWAFIAGFARTDPDEVERAVGDRLPRRFSAGYLGLMVLLFGVNWLRQLWSAASGGVPADLATIAWPMNPVWVLDLAIVLPVMALTAVRLVRGLAATHLGIPVLVFMAMLGITILSMAVSMAIDGQVIDLVLPVLFGLVVIVSGTLAILALAPPRTPLPGHVAPAA